VETPLIRAKAKDAVDALDNLTAYFEPNAKVETIALVRDIFTDIGKVMAHATENGEDPTAAYETFVAKFDEYWNSPPE
jgi:hypothetical protein